VTQPIKYAKHKNNRRVWLTILLVWAISAAIGSPIVLGLNNTPDRIPDQCLFYNTDFIIYSSLSSFYIPCIIMVFLYYNIFKVRERQRRRARNPLPCWSHISRLFFSFPPRERRTKGRTFQLKGVLFKREDLNLNSSSPEEKRRRGSETHVCESIS